MSALIYAALATPLAGAAATALCPSGRAVKWLNVLAGLASSLVLLWLVQTVFTGGAVQYGMFYVDQLSGLLLAVIAVLNFTATLFSASYMEKELIVGKNDLAALKRYYILFDIFAFTMVSVLVVENLGLMWVAVEATTLASALLVAFYFNRQAVEAAWKYVMVCTVGICLALLGTILLYYAQVSVGADGGEALSWLALRGIGDRLDPAMLKLAFVFILVGYGTKVGLAPMHTWLPDAHSQAPSPVSGLLSGALLSCALYAIIRNMIVVRQAVGMDFMQPLLVGLGLFSVIIAIPFLLVQKDVKRLLAYSSVEHMGIITLAIGIGTPLAVYGALLHIFNHAVTKSALFYLAGLITQEYRTRHIKRITGLIVTMPLAATAFVMLVLAITGTPPFSMFFSKFIIAWAIFQDSYQLVGGVLLVLLGAVFTGMLYYCLQMVFSAPAVPGRNFPVAAPAMTAVLLSVAIVAITGLWRPEYLDALLHQAAAIVMGG